MLYLHFQGTTDDEPIAWKDQDVFADKSPIEGMLSKECHKELRRATLALSGPVDDSASESPIIMPPRSLSGPSKHLCKLGKPIMYVTRPSQYFPLKQA